MIVAAASMLVGYVINIVDLVHSTLAPMTVLVLLRFIGIIVPFLGGVLGLFF